MTNAKPCKCPCGNQPLVCSDDMTGIWSIECVKCMRLVAAKGRAECFRMWTAATVYMRDKREMRKGVKGINPFVIGNG